jgi:hypothetical protein
VTRPERASIELSSPSKVSSTHRRSPERASAPTDFTAVTSCAGWFERASIRNTRSSSVATQTMSVTAARSTGAASRGIVAIARRDLMSIRVTVASPKFATHTEAGPTAIAFGSSPTGIRLRTRGRRESMKVTLSAPVFATQMPPAGVTAIPLGASPTGIERPTISAPGAATAWAPRACPDASSSAASSSPERTSAATPASAPSTATAASSALHPGRRRVREGAVRDAASRARAPVSPPPGTAASAARPISRAEANRSSGSFSIARRATPARRRGTSGASSVASGGVSEMWAQSFATSSSRGNGTCPVSVS